MNNKATLIYLLKASYSSKKEVKCYTLHHHKEIVYIIVLVQ